jgi:hypothetical protein
MIGDDEYHQGRFYGTCMPVPQRVFLLQTQSTYNQRSDKLEIMVMWARLSGQHLLKSTTKNANIQRIRIVILG